MKRDQRYHIRRAIEICGGTQAALAAAVGVSQPTVSRWLRGQAVDYAHAFSVQEATHGEVTQKKLRPDVKW